MRKLIAFMLASTLTLTGFAQSPSAVLSGLGVRGVASTGGMGYGNRLIKTLPDGTLSPSFLSAMAYQANVPESYIYLNSNYTGVQDGSQARPYSSLDMALASSKAVDDVSFVFSPGSYSGANITSISRFFIDGKANIGTIGLYGNVQVNVSKATVSFRRNSAGATVVTATDSSSVTTDGTLNGYTAYSDSTSIINGNHGSYFLQSKASAVEYKRSPDTSTTVQSAISDIYNSRAPVAMGAPGSVAVWATTNWAALTPVSEGRFSLTSIDGVPAWLPSQSKGTVKGQIPFWNPSLDNYSWIEPKPNGRYEVEFSNGVPSLSSSSTTNNASTGAIAYWNGKYWAGLAKGATNTYLRGGMVPTFSPLPVQISAATNSGQILAWDNSSLSYKPLAAGLTNQVLYGGAKPEFKFVTHDSTLPQFGADVIGAMVYWTGSEWAGITPGDTDELLYGGESPQFKPSGLPSLSTNSVGSVLYWTGVQWTGVTPGSQSEYLSGGSVPRFKVPVSAVTSVNSKTGNVVITANNIGAVSRSDLDEWMTGAYVLPSELASGVKDSKNDTLEWTAEFGTNLVVSKVSYTVSTNFNITFSPDFNGTLLASVTEFPFAVTNAGVVGTGYWGSNGLARIEYSNTHFWAASADAGYHIATNPPQLFLHFPQDIMVGILGDGVSNTSPSLVNIAGVTMPVPGNYLTWYAKVVWSESNRYEVVVQDTAAGGGEFYWVFAWTPGTSSLINSPVVYSTKPEGVWTNFSSGYADLVPVVSTNYDREVVATYDLSDVPQLVEAVAGKLDSLDGVATHLSVVGGLTVDGIAVTANETDPLFAMWAATNRVTRWYADANHWLESTPSNVVWQKEVVSFASESYIITLSPDFLETIGGTRPIWTTHSWPFYDGDWLGESMDFDIPLLIGPNASWSSDDYGYPKTLRPSNGYSQGSAVISAQLIYMTNSIPLYLPTNEIPLETWSYSDMTNWMADGNAGQLWASGLADDAAHAFINNHDNDPMAHDQRFQDAESNAQAALATNMVTRWYANENHWLESTPSNVVWQYSVVSVNLPYAVVFSDDFGYGPTLIRPSLKVYPFDPNNEGRIEGFNLQILEGAVEIQFIIEEPYNTDSQNYWQGLWYNEEQVFPCTMFPNGETFGTVYAGAYINAVTNSVPLYLPTNEIPLETWGYSDMTNWMANGNAGQLWVIGLADDAAQTFIYNHDTDPMAHQDIRDSIASKTDVQRIVTPNGDRWIDATGGVWQITNSESTVWFFEHNYNGGFTGIVSSLDYPAPDNFYFELGGAIITCLTEDPYDHYSEIRFEDYGSLWGTTDPSNGLNCTDDTVTARLYPELVQIVTTNHIDTISLTSELGTAVAGKLDRTGGVASNLAVVGGLTVDGNAVVTNVDFHRIGFNTATNATGTNWVAIGDEAAIGAGGDGWVALGYKAGTMAGPSDYWNAIGMNAGLEAYGRYFTAIGNESGHGATGNYWAAIGHLTGKRARGNNWFAIGQQAGQDVEGDYWTAVGLNSGVFAGGSSWSSLGRNAGRMATGDFWNAIGNYSGQYSSGNYNTYIGSWAGKNATGNHSFFFDSFGTDPGLSYNPTNSLIYLQGDTKGEANIGRPDGSVNLRGTVKYNQSEIINMSMLHSNTANEIIVDVSGYGHYTSITQALKYVDSIHATNATAYVNIHVVAGLYAENPVFKGYTVVRGDVRRSRIIGNTTVIGGPTFFDGFDFRTTDGTPPLTFDSIQSTPVLANCYILNSGSFDNSIYGVVMTNSVAYVHINNSELYVRNTSTHAEAKAVLVKTDSGGFELVDMRLKTSSENPNSFENEYLAWMTGDASIQVERCHYLVLHDTNGNVYMGDPGVGFEWIDSSVANNENPTHFLNFYGDAKDNVTFYSKETGSLKVNGNLTLISTNNVSSEIGVDVSGGLTVNGNAVLTNEQDLAAMRLYHYGSTDIHESPTNWFGFDGSGMITGFNWEDGRENVVIPWAIGGVDVVAVGVKAFDQAGIVSVVAPKTLTTFGNSAFYGCGSLLSVTYNGNAPTYTGEIYYGMADYPINYVTNPQATGWGDTFGGGIIVWPPLFTDRLTAKSITLNGVTATEWLNSNDVIRLLQPTTRTVYGDFSVTNVAGAAGFSIANPATIVTMKAVAYAVAGTNDIVFAFPFSSNRRMVSAHAVAYAYLVPYGKCVMEVKDQAGAVVASDTRYAVSEGPTKPCFTNTVISIPGVVTSGVVRLIYTMGKPAGAAGTELGTGGAYPLTLTFSTAPTEFATAVELGAAVAGKLDRMGGSMTNLTLAGTTSYASTNGFTYTEGYGRWTNGVDHGKWFSYDGLTNFWILLK